MPASERPSRPCPMSVAAAGGSGRTPEHRRPSAQPSGLVPGAPLPDDPIVGAYANAPIPIPIRIRIATPDPARR